MNVQAQQEWADIEAAYERFRRDDPAGWADYLTELSEWDEVSADPGNTSDEWPEFNM
ncbi:MULTISPECIES: hypothetical protein [unclassified Frankia]|uniref:hypothetical protein n=1 Tax=unclassified Frankia TaxID=2632575 RepID=UPI002AD5B29A|nr:MULTISPECIES: hypothetical protein [unclassified Frankia]